MNDSSQKQNMFHQFLLYIKDHEKYQQKIMHFDSSLCRWKY